MARFAIGKATSGSFMKCVRVAGGQGSMNDPEVTMPDPLRPIHDRLHAHEVALEAAGIVIRLACRVPPPLQSLADQAIRAASSVALNLAEGAGRNGRDASTTGGSPTAPRWRPDRP